MTDDVVAKRYPYFNFYPQDWLGDYELGRCSLAAQGLWLAMLCVMHQSEPRGYLIEHGQPMSMKGLSRLVRTQSNRVYALVKELENNGVFSRSNEGIIYCRKMVHDTEKRTKLRVNGKSGGNPKLKKDNQKDNQTANQEPNPYGNTNSNSNTNIISIPTEYSSVSSETDALPCELKKARRRSDPAKQQLLTFAGDCWNETAERFQLATIRSIDGGRERAVLSRAKELITTYDFETAEAGFAHLFSRIAMSPFLRGDTGKWKVTFDWMVKAENFRKILEGNYER